MSTSIAKFDTSRAMLRKKDLFEPFHVMTTHPLREMLAHSEVRGDAQVLVMQRGDRVVALLTHQMVYHHVAQGSTATEPWMVSF